jgi:hypothetical protein
MGRWITLRRSRQTTDAAPASRAEWYEDVERLARAQGAMPYVVEGYLEINEAVRRGHSVLLKREPATVADGVRVFDDIDAGHSGVAGWSIEQSAPAPDEAVRIVDPAGFVPRPNGDRVVTVLTFNVRTARFVVTDASSAVGSIELTPKRLQRYVQDPTRAVGVALGA